MGRGKDLTTTTTEEKMNTTVNFQRTPASDGIHRHVYFNECHNNGERLVTVGQLVCGTLMAFFLIMAYVFVAWLEG
jgi:hypothetical protein